VLDVTGGAFNFCDSQASLEAIKASIASAAQVQPSQVSITCSVESSFIQEVFGSPFVRGDHHVVTLVSAVDVIPPQSTDFLVDKDIVEDALDKAGVQGVTVLEVTEEPEPTLACSFVNEPITNYFWDSGCQMGMLGCYADGVHVQCRFCGSGAYSPVQCPATPVPAPAPAPEPTPEACSFVNEPITDYYWDWGCKMGMLGCYADGVHVQCRFCGSGSYSVITCRDAGADANADASALGEVRRHDSKFQMHAAR